MASSDEDKSETQSYKKGYLNLQNILMAENWEEFLSEAMAIFHRYSNPFQFTMFCLSGINLKELCVAKDNSFPSRLLKVFIKFQSIDGNRDKYSMDLTVSVQLRAFEIVNRLKNRLVQKYLINSFSLQSIPDILVPLLIKDLEQRSNHKDTINIIKSLEFGSHFDTKDLLIPLLLNNKVGVIEDFLKADSTHRLAFLQILDKITGNVIHISDLLQTYNVKEVKNKDILKEKFIYKLGIRLMKEFGIPSENCPNIIIRHNKSSLRYLFHRHYIENGLSLESLLLFAKELSEKNYALKKEVVTLFLDYCDNHSALLYLKEIPIEDEDIPHQLKNTNESLDDSYKVKKYINSTTTDFYKLNLSFESVVIVETISQFEESMNHFCSCSVIAIDTEWKPSHQFDEEEKFSLFQVSSETKVYLFDMIILPSLLSENHWNDLGSLLSNESILKLTYGFSGDRKKLGAINKFLKDHVNRMNKDIDLDVIKAILMKNCPDIYSYKTVEHKGLSELVYLCFGKPLDKTEQCSYWTVRPLSERQIVYAAIDVYCLFDIYSYLNEKSKQMNISDWKSLKGIDLSSLQTKVPEEVTSKRKLPAQGLHSRPRQSVCASSFTVVCDNMLQGLGKLLRFCNINAAILDTTDYHDKCIDYFEKEKRVVLTKGNVYHRLRKYIPESHIYLVKAEVPRKQLQELVSFFQITISEEDVFARCPACNCNQYLYVEPSTVSKMKYNCSVDSSRSLNTKSKWISVKGGSINLFRGITDSDVNIKLNDVPYPVLTKVSVIYICSRCGKCYWDGSHFDRFLNDISSVVQKSFPNNAVTPPLPL